MFFQIRTTLKQYYSVPALLLGLLSLALFAQIAWAVFEAASLVAFDLALAEALHGQAAPAGTSFYNAVTWFGGQGIWVVGISVGLYLAAHRHWQYFMFWLLALAGGGLLNRALKTIFARPRPFFADPLVIETFYSFPSAHAMTALITYGMLAYLLCQVISNRYARILIVFCAALLIVLIGISRLMLGVHYFSDVVGGFAAGGMWLSVCLTALHGWQRRRHITMPDV